MCNSTDRCGIRAIQSWRRRSRGENRRLLPPGPEQFFHGLARPVMRLHFNPRNLI